MSHIRGIVVNLVTSSSSDEGTDDHLYIGVQGTGGGREFPLAVSGFDDFERGSNVTYALGTVWDGTAISDPAVKNPDGSSGNGWNDPGRYRIELEDVTHVYIRKGGTRKGEGDDRYRFDSVEVTLYGANPESRAFGTTTEMRLANEWGLQVWLPEERGPLSTFRAPLVALKYLGV